MRKLTQVEIIKKFKKVHGDKYDYTNVKYAGTTIPVIIICSVHGKFLKRPIDHSRGQGCQQCVIDAHTNRVKLTTDIAISRFKKAHGDTYDYSKVIYTTSAQKVKIICPNHGLFEQQAISHWLGFGCQKCSGDLTSVRFLKSKTDVIDSFKKAHGEKYDYSKVNYINSKEKVIIICKYHGEFEQSPHSHKRGIGCPTCGHNANGLSKRHLASTIINKFIKVHGDKYGYDKVVYKGIDTKVIIYCEKHGLFKQTPYQHIDGQGCIKCGFEKTAAALSKSNDEWVLGFKKIHGDKYAYDTSTPIRSNKKIKINCTNHGTFFQTTSNHLLGQGCPSCKANKATIRLTLDTSDAVSKFKRIHGDNFNYSKVNYINDKTKVEIICPKHGSFMQRPNDHKNGVGCPSCVGKISKKEKLVGDYVESLGFEVIRNSRNLLKGNFEADIFLPEKNIIIEFDGTIWHSELYAKNKYNILAKTKMCNEAGYRCIHIFEDQYTANPELIHSLLRSALGIYKVRIGARETIKLPLSNKEYKNFCSNHLHGFRPGKHKRGLYYDGELVAAISYNADGELVRYIVKNDWQVLCALAKLIKNEEITYSYCDLTFFDGKSYPAAGFEFLYNTKPNYRYIKNKQSLSRQTMQKHKLAERFGNFDNELTEVQNCANNGWYRLFDAGNAKYELIKPVK